MSETDLPEDFGTVMIDGKKYVSGQCLDCAVRDQQIAAQAELIARLRGALSSIAFSEDAYDINDNEKIVQEALNSTPESLAKVAEAKLKVVEAAIEACERGWVMGNGDLLKAVNALQAAERNAK